MTTDIGPGTRLLCVEEVPSNCEHIIKPIRTGTIYTCLEVVPAELLLSDRCPVHGTCSHGGVSLREFGVQVYMRPPWLATAMYCLGQFIPIGGDLPEEITRQLETNYTGPIENVKIDINKKAKEPT